MGELAKRFGEEVRGRRRARGFTQAQLAEATGLSEEWVRRIERGDGAPSFDTLEALGRALGVAVADLFTTHQPHETARLSGLLGLTAGLSDSEVAWLEKTVRQMLARPED